MIHEEVNKVGDHVLDMVYCTEKIQHAIHYAPEDLKIELQTSLDKVTEGLLELSALCFEHFIKEQL